jgi:hypothetical protein
LSLGRDIDEMPDSVCKLFILIRWTHDFQMAFVVSEAGRAAIVMRLKKALVQISTDAVENNSLTLFG